MTSSFDPEGREAALLASVPELDRARVLEIGVGDGRMTWHYAGHARLVVGVDPDAEAVGQMHEDRTADLRRHVHGVIADSEHLPFARERFDAAVLSWSL